MFNTARATLAGMQLMFALAACAPAQPQPDNQAKPAAPLKLVLARQLPESHKAPPDPRRPAPASSRTAPVPAAAQQRPAAWPREPLVRAAVIEPSPRKARAPTRAASRARPNRRASTARKARTTRPATKANKAGTSGKAATASTASQPDWTALFKAWENGCRNSPAFDAFQKRFAFFDRQHGLELGQIDLPDAFKAATGTPTSRYRDDHSSYILPVTAGSYYGIPVKAIEFYTGHENGINGKQLVLDAPEKVVKKILRQKKVVFKKGNAHRAIVSGTATQSAVTCDDSD